MQAMNIEPARSFFYQTAADQPQLGKAPQLIRILINR